MDRMRIGNRETPKLLPGIEPLSPYELTVVSYDRHFIGGLSDVIRSISQNIQPPDFSGIHQITQPRITVVTKPITVPVHEDSHGVGMIEMHPPLRQDTLKVAKHDGVQPRVLLPLGCPIILSVRLGSEGKGVEVSSRTGQLHPRHTVQKRAQPERLNVRCPVIESVVLSGWSKFHLFGGQVDDAIIGLGMVVATRGRMIVEISADPTGGVHQSFQCDRKVLTAAFLQGDHLTDMRKFNPVGHHHTVASR